MKMVADRLRPSVVAAAVAVLAWAPRLDDDMLSDDRALAPERLTLDSRAADRRDLTWSRRASPVIPA
jgi:hypothetical protein